MKKLSLFLLTLACVFQFSAQAQERPSYIAIERRIRPVQYRPEFRLERAAVSTTMFIMLPIYGTPSLEKNVTNGLCPA